jgi:hypothetical protein
MPKHVRRESDAAEPQKENTPVQDFRTAKAEAARAATKVTGGEAAMALNMKILQPVSCAYECVLHYFYARAVLDRDLAEASQDLNSRLI